LRALIDWVAEKLGRQTPLHFSRYHPDYRLNQPPTPAATLQRAYELAREKLDYVYVGNIQLPGTDDTHCPHCRQAVIRRTGFYVAGMNLKGTRCGHCGAEVHVVLGTD
jgi:pyruvate formate lyase activating enzyme